jgi:ribosomal protein S18 acetylase RimI-like enzyme
LKIVRIGGSASRGFEGQAADLCAEAFSGDPLYRAACPSSSDDRRATARAVNALLIRFGLRYGLVEATGGELEGFSVWLPPPQTAMDPLKMLRSGALRLATEAPLAALARLARFDAQADRARERDAPGPHWRLLLLAVRPESQGTGIASSLVRPFLERLDALGERAYLDTQNPRNVSLYLHYGFALVGEQASAALPGVINFSMRRPAREARLREPLRPPPPSSPTL